VTVPHHASFNAYPLTMAAWVQVGNQSSIILRRLVPNLGGYWISVTNGTVYAGM